MLPEAFQDTKVSIIGLGYVGMTLAVAMAEAGFHVRGIEIAPHILAALKQGRAHFAEYGLNDRLAAQLANGRFRFGEAPDIAFGATVHIVTVGTPVGPDKRTKFAGLEAAARGIADTMADGDLIVLRSTVRVGTTQDIVKPILASSGKGFDLAFCPERTLEGKALAELVSLPQIVGGVDAQSTYRASQVFSHLTPTIIRVRNAETAELIKLINTQRDLMFGFANEVASICDALGVSAHEVIAGGNVGYPRAQMPLPGPVGGPCLEKDPYILAEGLEAYGFVPAIAMAGRKWNETLPERSVGEIAEAYAKLGGAAPKRIALLGVAFKGRPATDDLRGSLAIRIASELAAQFPDAEIKSWDAEASHEEMRVEGFDPVGCPIEAATGASIVIMQNNHVALENIKLDALAGAMTGPGLIYDYWNQHSRLEDTAIRDGIRYAALGSLNVKR
jgi:UDP-N-acetyl-D-mannosaminuronic acid dehydrogenase